MTDKSIDRNMLSRGRVWHSRAAVAAGAVAALTVLGACSDTNVPYYTAPTSVSESPAGIQNAVTGVFAATRIDIGGIVTTLSAGYGRNGAVFENTEARTVQYPLGVLATPTSSGGDLGAGVSEHCAGAPDDGRLCGRGAALHLRAARGAERRDADRDRVQLHDHGRSARHPGDRDHGSGSRKRAGPRVLQQGRVGVHRRGARFGQHRSHHSGIHDDSGPAPEGFCRTQRRGPEHDGWHVCLIQPGAGSQGESGARVRDRANRQGYFPGHSEPRRSRRRCVDGRDDGTHCVGHVQPGSARAGPVRGLQPRAVRDHARL